MILKEWSHNFDFNGNILRTLPIWVKLPHLPLHLWGAKSMGKIVSALGRSLFTGACTTSKLRVSYARLLVEVDITQKQKESITIKDNKGKKINQPVEFEWKPKYCDTFQKVGR